MYVWLTGIGNATRLKHDEWNGCLRKVTVEWVNMAGLMCSCELVA